MTAKFLSARIREQEFELDVKVELAHRCKREDGGACKLLHREYSRSHSAEEYQSQSTKISGKYEPNRVAGSPA